MLAIQRFDFTPFDQVLDSVAQAAEGTWTCECFAPVADVSQTEAGYRIDIDLPGLTESDVQVTVEGKHLTVKGERKAPENGETYTRQERAFGEFQRVFHLPDDVDVTRIEAKAKAGVLTLSLPKAESAKPKTIQVVPA